jgi:hypothetical protein
MALRLPTGFPLSTALLLSHPGLLYSPQQPSNPQPPAHSPLSRESLLISGRKQKQLSHLPSTESTGQPATASLLSQGLNGPAFISGFLLSEIPPGPRTIPFTTVFISVSLAAPLLERLVCSLFCYILTSLSVISHL